MSPSRDGYWINDSLLVAWLERASGDDLAIVLSVVDGASVLTRKCLPVIMRRDLLNHKDRLIREIVVRLIGRGARFGVIGHEEGVRWLRQREKTEGDPRIQRSIRREVRLLMFKKRRSDRSSQR